MKIEFDTDNFLLEDAMAIMRIIEEKFLLSVNVCNTDLLGDVVCIHKGNEKIVITTNADWIENK